MFARLYWNWVAVTFALAADLSERLGNESLACAFCASAAAMPDLAWSAWTTSGSSSSTASVWPAFTTCPSFTSMEERVPWVGGKMSDFLSAEILPEAVTVTASCSEVTWAVFTPEVPEDLVK